MPAFDRICVSCGISIDDPYYLMIVDQTWHSSCLKCADCGVLLEHERTCFMKHGQIFCKSDYLRRYSSRVCARCSRSIQADEIILRAEHLIFHVQCFTCHTCTQLLRSGDEFGIRENSIYCPEHLISTGSPARHDDSGYQTSPNELCKSRRCQQEKEEHCGDFSSMFLSSSYYLEFDDQHSDRSHPTKQKRLRTSFKHHQLRYMRSYFHFNHNPDAKDLKNLSEKTNLPKRVLQVWFQNARAKFRRGSVLSRDDPINFLSPNKFQQSNTCLSSA